MLIEVSEKIVALVDTFTCLRLRLSGFRFYRQSMLSFFKVFPPRPIALTTIRRSSEKHVSYWYRPHTSKKRLPIVFIHGIGIGEFHPLFPRFPSSLTWFIQRPSSLRRLSARAPKPRHRLRRRPTRHPRPRTPPHLLPPHLPHPPKERTPHLHHQNPLIPQHNLLHPSHPLLRLYPLHPHALRPDHIRENFLRTAYRPGHILAPHSGRGVQLHRSQTTQGE